MLMTFEIHAIFWIINPTLFKKAFLDEINLLFPCLSASQARLKLLGGTFLCLSSVALHESVYVLQNVFSWFAHLDFHGTERVRQEGV